MNILHGRVYLVRIKSCVIRSAHWFLDRFIIMRLQHSRGPKRLPVADSLCMYELLAVIGIPSSCTQGQGDIYRLCALEAHDVCSFCEL